MVARILDHLREGFDAGAKHVLIAELEQIPINLVRNRRQ